ncbi:MAG: ATPase [Chitinophagaceae bacterium]|nr:MAG: ATPase [Chitinophagaceae bacterium]
MANVGNSFRREGKELIHTRVLNAPRSLVWEVWTNPDHLREWWGPDGFTITTNSIEVKPGKEWSFVMHGFGRDFDNIVTYLEVVEPSLLSYHHGDPGGKISFKVSIAMEDIGDKTKLTIRSVFQSAEILDQLDREVNAIEGGKQTYNRMEKYLQGLVIH